MAAIPHCLSLQGLHLREHCRLRLCQSLVRLARPAIPILAIAFYCASPVPSRAQEIYLTSYNDGTGEYDTSGNAIPGFSAPGGITAVATSAGAVYASSQNTGTVGSYDPVTGDPTVGFTPFQGSFGLAVSGNTLYSGYAGTVATYDATTGDSIDPTFITGLTGPFSLTINGSDLYVSTGSGETVNEYDAGTGDQINDFVSPGDLDDPAGMAIFGNDLFIANYDGGTVGEYDATTGAEMEQTFIGGLAYPEGLAILGDDLLVVQNGGSKVSEFDASTGDLVDLTFISGVPNPQFISVSPVPEPGTWGLLAGGLGLLFGSPRLRRSLAGR